MGARHSTSRRSNVLRRTLLLLTDPNHALQIRGAILIPAVVYRAKTDEIYSEFLCRVWQRNSLKPHSDKR